MTVHPRDRSVSIAASPVDEGADPPDWSNTPAAIPDATSDTNTLSMLVCVSAVLVNASVKSPPITLSNSPAGIVVRLLQFCQDCPKSVPDDVSIRGKLVRLAQPRQVWLKSVPDDVSIRGKDVRLLQPRQARLKSVPDEVSMSGKDVRLLQLFQARKNLVTEDVSMSGKDVRPEQ